MYGITIYENGEIIDPCQDDRLKDLNVSWIYQNKIWANRTFSRSEIMEMFADLYHISSTLES